MGPWGHMQWPLSEMAPDHHAAVSGRCGMCVRHQGGTGEELLACLPPLAAMPVWRLVTAGLPRRLPRASTRERDFLRQPA